jgi:hypothetical protein
MTSTIRAFRRKKATSVENPEAFRELLGPQHLSSRSTERAPAQFITSAGWFVFAQRCQPIYC